MVGNYKFHDVKSGHVCEIKYDRVMRKKTTSPSPYLSNTVDNIICCYSDLFIFCLFFLPGFVLFWGWLKRNNGCNSGCQMCIRQKVAISPVQTDTYKVDLLMTYPSREPYLIDESNIQSVYNSGLKDKLHQKRDCNINVAR
jgi:hypothetical protein